MPVSRRPTALGCKAAAVEGRQTRMPETPHPAGAPERVQLLSFLWEPLLALRPLVAEPMPQSAPPPQAPLQVRPLEPARERLPVRPWVPTIVPRQAHRLVVLLASVLVPRLATARVPPPVPRLAPPLAAPLAPLGQAMRYR